MTVQQLETRVAALEAEVARLRSRIEDSAQRGKNTDGNEPWWRRIAGTFEGDPIYAEAMRLGREYRESLRPRPRRPKKKK